MLILFMMLTVSHDLDASQPRSHHASRFHQARDAETAQSIATSQDVNSFIQLCENNRKMRPNQACSEIGSQDDIPFWNLKIKTSQNTTRLGLICHPLRKLYSL